MVEDGRAVVVWGEGVYRVELRSGKVRRLAMGSFRDSGCVAEGGLVLVSGDRLVWLAGPRYDWRQVIDTGAEIADCVEATLLGRRGILVTWRGLQVRHYFPGEPGEARWPYREIYSFYTASYQAGLLVRDVDGDGRADLICGNYWIQSPESYDLPWRLFAINTYNDQPLSARMRMAWMDGTLVVAQGALEQGRVAVFERPEDPKQLWKERVLGTVPTPNVLAVVPGVGFVTRGLRLWRGGRFDVLPGTAGCIAAWSVGKRIVCLETAAVRTIAVR